MLPLLRRSASPRIVNMSSTVGSLTKQTGSAGEQAVGPISAAYAPSKTFLSQRPCSTSHSEPADDAGTPHPA
jgi:NAD(P)-dependent dehydrogenase (short-subunit alcohol dehydrogenase family)